MEGNGAVIPPAMRKPSSGDSSTSLLRIESFALTLVPWLLFISVLTGSSFVCLQFQLSASLVAVAAAVLSGLMAFIGLATRGAAPLALGLLCLSAVSISFGVGLYVSETWTEEYFHIVHGATYENRSADSHARKLADASVLIFDRDVGVDVDQAIGYRNSGQTFCVAPVVSRPSISLHGRQGDEDEAKADTPPPALSPRPDARRHGMPSQLLLAANGQRSRSRDVQFWAVGMGCCGDGSDFHCGRALSPKAHSAIVLANQADGYKQAVRMALPIHGLTSAHGAIFVRWVESPTRFQLDLLKSATCAVGVAILVHLLASVPAGIAISRALTLQTMHA